MYYVVTGAAGFIGSNLVRALNARGETQILAVDDLERSDKFRNLAACEIADYIDKDEFRRRIEAGDFSGAIDIVFHQGACSDTMETDGRFMMENNYRYSTALLDFCVEDQVPLLYASSAAVYGAGREFREERKSEAPLNIYGYSKLLFDQAVRRRLGEAGSQIAGFRYFNVYGLNEWHKGRMASVAWHFFNQYAAERRLRPFVGSGGYGDGEQRRDFVSVHDVARAFALVLEVDAADGLAVTVGSGHSVAVRELATKLGVVVGRELEPELTGESRVGDIRHCFADVALARDALGYTPAIELEAGMGELAAWLEGQTAVDRVEDAAAELSRRGLSL